MTRSFAANDHPICIKCGSPTCLISRGPDPDHGMLFERRRFECAKCNIRFERSATLVHSVDPMREPAVRGWLKGGLATPD